jgi:hypothetical protein
MVDEATMTRTLKRSWIEILPAASISDSKKKEIGESAQGMSAFAPSGVKP